MRGAVEAKRKRGSRGCRVSEEVAGGSEQESEADLDLAAGIGKVAVAAGRSGEWRIKVQAGQIGGSHGPQSTRYGSSGGRNNVPPPQPLFAWLGPRAVFVCL